MRIAGTHGIMNPSTSSTQQGDDPTWPCHESWDHTVRTAGAAVLDSRQYGHPARLDWEWETPVLLTQHSATCSEDQESEECKPNIIADHNMLIGANLSQHSSLNPLSFHSNDLPHNSLTWGLQSPSFGGETAMVDSSSSALLASAGAFGQHAVAGGMLIPGLYGFSAGSSPGFVEQRSTLEQHRHLLELVHMDQQRLQDNVVPDFAARLGLNLGGRTYFSADDHMSSMIRFGKRHRPNSPGAQVPMCQAEGCKADLSFAKHYHRRHKVCEFHSKASSVIIGGQTQRFCQQCSRFHMLSEFDEGKRSCRKRLADHNRRRRKPQIAASSAAATISTTTELTTPKNIDQKQDHIASDSQTKAVSESPLVSLVQNGVPLLLQNGTKQVPFLGGRPGGSEAYQRFVESHSSCSTSSAHLQPSNKNLSRLDVAPWLKHIASEPSTTGISDSSSSNRLLLDSAGGPSTMQSLSLSMQKLLPLQPKSEDHGDHANWRMSSIGGQGGQAKPKRHDDLFCSIERGVGLMSASNNPKLQDLIPKQQLQLSNSASNLNDSRGMEFHGLIGLRPYNNQ